MKLLPGEGLQAIRSIHEMSLETLSALTGIDQQKLKEIEQSEGDMSPEHAAVLGCALRTIPELLLSWNRNTLEEITPGLEP